VVVSAWSQRPFSDVVLDTPELAGCFHLMPGAWAAAQPPEALADPGALRAVISSLLAGVLVNVDPFQLSVVVAQSENAALSAVASGTTILLIVPSGAPIDLQQAARVVIVALALAHSMPAAPDARSSEPLLAFGEAIALAGSVTLATLPPELRPVSDWLEADEAAKPLNELAQDSLDGDKPWASRRVRMQQTALRSGANATLLNAAARVVEAYGDVVRARREPYDMLLAWRENKDKKYPPMSGVLKRALANPLNAGMPSKSRAEDARPIAQEALERRIDSGTVATVDGAGQAELRLRVRAAAEARARGTGTACAWLLAGPVPDSFRTGCRSNEKAAAFLSSRPVAQGGFEVFAATAPDETVLLHWRSWALFPLLVPDAGLIVFADAEGIEAVPLDSSSAPRVLAAGAFRHLALSPDGKRIAAARWPEGTLVTLTLNGEAAPLTVDARGGIAWLDNDLVVAAGKDGATVAAVSGGTRSLQLAVPCTRTLARQGQALLFGEAAPCETGVLQVLLGSTETKLVLKRSDAPLGLVPQGDGSLVFGDAEGIWRWRPGDAPTRIEGGLTPGPG
jgi:hypothetical protein